MLPDYFVIIGAVVALIGGLYYLYETIVGTTQPNRVTWILSAIFPMVTFIAQKTQGVEGIAWVSFISGLTPALIVAASFFNKKAYWKTRSFDYVCLGIGVIGIGLWGLTSNPNLAIVFAILADFAAAFPTILKAHMHPETESWIAFALNAIGFAICVLAIHTWTFENYAFVTYLVAINGLIAILAFHKTAKTRLKV